MLTGLGVTGIVTIGDFLTYSSISNVGSAANGIVNVTLGAENKMRPLIRLPAPSPNVSEWVFTGGDAAHLAQLTLDGLFVSGGDIVLRGYFDTVTLVCVTLDPGNADTVSGYAQAADGRDLIPSRLWVEGSVKSLNIDRSIIGPIRTRANGTATVEIETLTLTNSIVQAVGIAYQQLVATGDGTTKSFNVTLTSTPIRPGTVQVVAATATKNSTVGTDNGNGAIIGSGLTGTVNYATGLANLTFATAPAASVTVTVVYYDNPLAIEMSTGLGQYFALHGPRPCEPASA